MGYDGLMLLPDGPRSFGEGPEGPGTLCECPARLVATRLDLSGQVGTCRNLSQLVGTCRNFSELLWPQGQDPGSLYLKTFRPDAIRLHPSSLHAVSFRPAGRTGDGPADLARSTAEGVGG